LAAQDYEAARRNVNRCIELAREGREPETVSLLLQFLGEVEYLCGDKKAALACDKAAELEAPESPLARVIFARFLINRLGDAKAALAKCDEVEEIIESSWLPGPDDLSKEEYLRRISEVREASGA
jgi:hypothetical protein